jgi:hypothetical protein
MKWEAGKVIYILWEFKISPENRAEFELAYRGDGVWAELFRRDPAYMKTILLKDIEGELGRYVTVDVWENRSAYSQFKDRFAHEYSDIDRRCEALTDSERLIGIFEALG